MAVNETNWDQHLKNIHTEFISDKYQNYRKSLQIFKDVFTEVKKEMEKQCPYFRQYGKQVLYEGNIYDEMKVSKLDELERNVVIRLPINAKDISLENIEPGFVELKIRKAFDLLPKQEKSWDCHKVAYAWRDTEKYLLQNEFRSWMHEIVKDSLKELNYQVIAKGVTYKVEYKKTDPGDKFKLNIQNEKTMFKLDVNLVPVLRFQRPRWPKDHRTVKRMLVNHWLVTPKPNCRLDADAQNRSWRLSFQGFERMMIRGCHQLKNTIRLVIKLRNKLQIGVSSYCIITLFLWKIDAEKEKEYWQKGLGKLFRTMVQEFHNAMENKLIPYFWHEQCNLIAHLNPVDLKVYAGKLKKVIDGMDKNNIDQVLAYLLSKDELDMYKKSKCYKKHQQAESYSKVPLRVCLPEPKASTSKHGVQNELNKESDGQPDDSEGNVTDLLHSLRHKIEERIEENTNNGNIVDIACEDNPNTLETATNDKGVVEESVIYILKSIQENVNELAIKKSKKEEIKELIGKIDMLVDKTNEQGQILMKLQSSDASKQKIDELDDAVSELMDESDDLVMDVLRETDEEMESDEDQDSSGWGAKALSVVGYIGDVLYDNTSKIFSKYGLPLQVCAFNRPRGRYGNY